MQEIDQIMFLVHEPEIGDSTEVLLRRGALDGETLLMDTSLRNLSVVLCENHERLVRLLADVR
jgi:hypothetical protein